MSEVSGYDEGSKKTSKTMRLKGLKLGWGIGFEPMTFRL
jgi:hypothetical protein